VVLGEVQTELIGFSGILKTGKTGCRENPRMSLVVKPLLKDIRQVRVGMKFSGCFANSVDFDARFEELQCPKIMHRGLANPYTNRVIFVSDTAQILSGLFVVRIKQVYCAGKKLGGFFHLSYSTSVI